MVLAAAIVAAGPFMALGAGPSTQDLVRQARDAWLASGAPGQKDVPGDAPDTGPVLTNVVNVSSYEFQGTNPFGDHIADDGNGYRYFSSAGSSFLSAPLRIPSGVTINSIQISSCDHTSGDIFLSLVDGLTGGPTGSILKNLSTTSGCGIDSVSLSYDYDQNQGHPLYLLLLWGATYDGTTRFNNVAIYYTRRVSPAPPSATFADVPTSNPQFQFIEALVDAGVTVGCGNGNYCPNQAVTRGQMAVFMAKALGLHFPN